jgi:hypothetical protein
LFSNTEVETIPPAGLIGPFGGCGVSVAVGDVVGDGLLIFVGVSVVPPTDVVLGGWSVETGDGDGFGVADVVSDLLSDCGSVGWSSPRQPAVMDPRSARTERRLMSQVIQYENKYFILNIYVY